MIFGGVLGVYVWCSVGVISGNCFRVTLEVALRSQFEVIGLDLSELRPACRIGYSELEITVVFLELVLVSS